MLGVTLLPGIDYSGTVLTPLQKLAALPGLVNWWQARLSSGYPPLVDSVGSANISTTTGGNNASYVGSTSILNGQPSIQTVSTGLVSPGNQWPAAHDFSIACVVAVSNGIGVNAEFFDDTTNNNLLHQFSANDLRMRWNSTGNDFTGSFTFALNVPILLICTYSASTNNMHFRANATDYGTHNVGSTDTRLGPINITGSLSPFVVENTGDFMIFNSVLSSTSIATIESAYETIYAY